ncbi:MAG: SIMPL domain-containing protein [Thermoguttaceae bacterium]
MICRFACSLVVVLGSTLLSSTGWAQPLKEGTIAASGSEGVRVQPTLLRLEVQLHASGATAEKAVEQIKTGRKAALAKLKDLNVEEGSIRFTNTVIAPNTDPGYVPLPAGFLPPTESAPADGTFVPRIAPKSPPTLVPPLAPASTSASSETTRPVIELGPPASTAPATISPALPPVASGLAPSTGLPGYTYASGTVTSANPSSSEGSLTAATTLRAEWRLTTSDPDSIALARESLREKLTAAHVFGESNPWCMVPTGTTAPAPNYMPQAYSSPTYARLANVGFTLYFVGTLSEPQRKAAMTVAMTKAQQRAAELAETAGGRLGDLCSASSDINQGMLIEPPFPSVSGMTLFPRADQSEVVSQSPDLPEFTVRITLNYRLSCKNPANP